MEAPSTDRLQTLLEAWYTELEAGRTPSVEVICAADPELIPVLRRMVDQEESAAGALSSLRPEPGARAIPAERLGDFRILAPLGEGGMGRVYVARQESLGRLVALKVLHEAAAGDPRTRFRFRREAEIAATLDHPNIVPVYAVGEDQGFCFIAMKRLTGPSLDRLEEPLPAPEAARIGAAVARALEEAHRAGVVHRDVKPGNVMLDGTVPYVLDFGLARADTDHTVTRKGTVPGTLPYMSPEQLRAGTTTLDSRTDIYSLGATLYELLAGRPAFDAGDPEVLIRQILFREPVPLGLRGANRDLETIVFRAMDKDRGRRFASAAALADDLDRWLRGDPIESRPITTVTRTVRLIRRHRRAAAVVGSLLLAVLALAAWLFVAAERDRAALEENLAALRRNIDDGNEPAARAVFGALSAQGRDPRVVAERRRFEAGFALEDLLDQVQDHRGAQDPGRLQALVAAADDFGPFAGDPRRERLRLLAMAVAGLHLGIPDEALRGIAACEAAGGGGRATAALRAVAAGRPIADLPASGPGGVDEHVFTVLAMRLQDRPVAEREAELAAPLQADPGDYRLRLAHAVLLAETGTRRADELALQVLRGLQRHGGYRPSVLRGLARQHLALGQLEAARRFLDQVARADGPRDAWTPALATSWCDLLFAEGRAREFQDLLRESTGRWPAHFDLAVRAAQDELARGRPADAARRFREAARLTGSREALERCEAQALVCEYAAVPGAEGVDPLAEVSPELATRIESLIAVAAGGGERFASASARSDALYVKARSLRLLGRRSEAREALRESMAADPAAPSPRLQLAAEVRLHADRLARGIANVEDIEVHGDVRRAIAEVRRELSAVTGADRSTTGRLGAPAEREDAWWYEAQFAFAVRDFEAAAKAASEVLASQKSRGSPDAKRMSDATALHEASEDRASK